MPFPAMNPALARALVTQGYLEPTPVQAAVLDEAAAGHDLLVSAQTGSGKTVAFGLALAPTLMGDAERMGPAGKPEALVIAPTRELALQVARELTWLYEGTNARVATCVGGMDARREQRTLSQGCHIVVGTPGRLRDHLERGHLDLTGLKAAVLDEADEMLDLGFREDLEAILDAAPSERRTLMFSATIAREIASLAKRYQKDAMRIDMTDANEQHGDIEYRVVRIAPNEIEHAVVNVLRYYEAGRALVFCARREGVRHLNAALRERGFSTEALSGELSQKERTEALQALRDGHARVCVATDVAARGLDLPDLGLVIHADLPMTTAALLHRSGRTGRAGRKGTSVLLVPYTRRRRVEQLLASGNIEAEWSGPPGAEEIRARDQQRLLEDPVLTEPSLEEDLPLAKALTESRSAEDIAMALIRMYRARLPAPELLFDGGPGRDRPERGPRRDGPDRGERPDRGPGGRGPAGRGREGGAPVMEDSPGFVWYRLSVGRTSDADPRWLLPLICRRGHVTRNEIGQIRIFDRETKFEIARAAEAKFAAALNSGPDDRIRIEPAGNPAGKRAARGPGLASGPVSIDDVSPPDRAPREVTGRGPRREGGNDHPRRKPGKDAKRR